MPSAIVPLDRLRALRRKLDDLLMGRRLSADPERTGVVDLSDFASRCEAFARYAAESAAALAGASAPEAACARRVCEDAELAARYAALLETTPRTDRRVAAQCDALEEAARRTEAAILANGLLEEPASLASASAIARKERDRFAPFVAFTGTIEDAPPALLSREELLRAIRRAALDRAFGTLELSVARDGRLTVGDRAFGGGAPAEGLPRGPHEPPEVKRALDLREATADPALRDFLLAKAVDEALFALLAPRLARAETVERARAFPTKAGKRGAVRPEAVRAEVPGWDVAEAARAVEKVAERRAGPEWARLPRGAYVLRLLVAEDDALAGDLLALAPALRRMERGEAVEGTRDRAERALRGLLGRLG